MANTRYGLHVQISEPKTSEPLPVHHMSNVSSVIVVFEIGRGRSEAPTFIVDTEGQFLRFVANKRRVSDWSVFVSALTQNFQEGGLKGVRTDVDGEISNGWKEDLDIRTRDEFGIHTSSVLKESAAQ